MQLEQKSHKDNLDTRADADRSAYLELVNFIPDGFIVTDANFLVLESNHAAEALLDVQRNLLIGESLLKFIPDDQQALIREKISRINTQAIDRFTDWEMELLKYDRSIIPCMATILGKQETESKPASFLWLLRDNSGQKQIDEALWASEKRFRSVAETASDAIIIFNSRLHLIYWNETAKNMFRYPSGETMYKLLGTIVTGDFSERLDRDIERIITTGQSELTGKSFEATGIRQNGQEFPIELSLATWQAGEDIYFTIIVRDISERKQAEQKLLISEKMASLGRLTAGIAHEINTPIAAVRAALVEATALVEECQVSIGDPEVSQNDWVEMVHDLHSTVSLAERSASRAARFVQSIRSQTQDPEAHAENFFDANIVITDSVMMLNHLFRKENCSFTYDAPREGVMLFGSPGRFSRIVINLLTNAIDASVNKGGGPISLSIRPVGNEIVMQVTDQGAGIKPEHISKLYDPMFTTKPFGEGSGLGLTIVHQNVTTHFGGKI